jgi:transposase
MNTKHSTAELERRRRLAVARIAEGWTQGKVAAFLGVNIRTVGMWWARHRADPVHGLDAKPRSGAKPKLTSEQEAEVLAWFREPATHFGFSNELWTAARVAQLIERNFGVVFNSNYISAWLAQRRITPQKPDTQARERDPAKIAHWLENDWSEIKRKLDGGAHLTLIDEAGALLMPLVRRTLAPRGQTPILKHRARQREKVSMIAALTVSVASPEPRLHFRTYPKDYVNNHKAADFVKHLLGELPGEVAVLWDGGPMHKGDPIRQLLADHDRLSLFRLPPYCPHFNPVEYLWSWLKYGKICNFAATDAASLDVVVRDHLDNACTRPALLQGFWDHCELPPCQLIAT